MAKADKVTTYERREVKKYEDVKTEQVQLTLSKEEAKALRAVLSHVGGQQEHGRKHADAIIKALDGLGSLPGAFRVVPNGNGLFFEKLDYAYGPLGRQYTVAPANPFDSVKW